MRTFLLGICILISSTIVAQRHCATTDYTELQKAKNPAIANRIDGVEQFISQQVSLKAKTEEENIRIIRIPVVVHVIYNAAYQNISDAQVQSQIDVLNRDFRRNNWDTVYTPARFKGLAADVQIEFALATADPQGRPTKGIVRKETNIGYWGTDDKIKQTSMGGDDAWDTEAYLNIWVGNLRSLLGYSSVPGCAKQTDGVVINFSAFGTINTGAPYHLGRTTVHEVGHWLGLKHIWGDTYCGDDSVDDTPRQGNFTAGCPNNFRSSCSNGTMGDMYMNYMDYTDDACVNMFTLGQKDRMQVLFNEGGPRNGLLSSKGLNEPWNAAAELPVQARAISIYPNPATNAITLNIDEIEKWIGKTYFIVNINGSVISQATVNSKNTKLDLAGLAPGVYFIRMQAGNEKFNARFFKL